MKNIDLKIKISFVIPCYNSSKTIPIVVTEILDSLKKKEFSNYEIILVNDGPDLKTFETIKSLCFKNDKIKGLNLSKNFGQASATLAGISTALGDVIVYSDDDGQTPVSDFWILLDKLFLKDADIVFAKYTDRKSSFLQKFGSVINGLMSSYLINKPYSLYMGNFWVCKKYIANELVKNKNPFPYIAGLMLKATNNIETVFVDHRERIEGKSNYTFIKMLSLWLNGFTAFSVRPLRFASVLGLIHACLGFCLLLVLVFIKIKNPLVPIGYTSIMSVLLWIGGIIMIILGLIGEYIGRIYININNIPQYVIKEKINYGPN